MIKNYIISAKFYNPKNSVIKNLILVSIEFFNIDIVPPVLPLFVYLTALIYNAFYIIFARLVNNLKELSFIRFLIKKFKIFGYEQYEILLLYYWKNEVHEYITGRKEALISAPEISKFYKILYTLIYIADNFLNTTEQYIERFFLIFRRIFIKLLFSTPDRIYYKIFKPDFHFKRVKKPKRFKLSVYYLLIMSRYWALLDWIISFCFYFIVSIKNLFLTIYEWRKNILIFLFLFFLFNLIFKESAFLIYRFLLSFFDIEYIISNFIDSASFDAIMNDMFNDDTKYKFFFKSEYKEFYSNGELHKLYYIYLTIKGEFTKNLENYWKFIKAFPPYVIITFHKYFFFKQTILWFAKRGDDDGKYRKAANRYSSQWREKYFREKVNRHTEGERNFNRRMRRFWDTYVWFFDDKIFGVFWILYEFIQAIYLLKDCTPESIILESHYKRDLSSSSIVFKFIFRVLFTYIRILTKILFWVFKSFIMKIVGAILFFISIAYFIIYLWPKRKLKVVIVIKGYTIFDCTWEDFVINLVLNSIMFFIGFNIIWFTFYYAPAILHFYIFRIIKPFLIFLLKKIRKYFNF